MAKTRKKTTSWEPKRIRKKTSVGMSHRTKWGNKGGGENGSTPSKKYRKKYRGQGK